MSPPRETEPESTAPPAAEPELLPSESVESLIHDVDVRAGLIRLLFRQVAPILLANLLVMPVTVLLLWENGEPGRLMLWGACILIITIFRVYLYQRFKRATPEDRELATWGRWFTVGAAMNGVVWGLGGLLFFVDAPLIEQTFIAAVLAGMTAGAAGASAAHMPAFYGFVLPAILPVAIYSLGVRDVAHLGMGGLLIIYASLVSIVARNFHLSLTETLALQAQKSRLLIRLGHAHRAAEAASRAKSAFLANMSHELRTPLNAINGFSQIMRDQMFGALGNERYRQYATMINDSGRHLLQLIEDVLDLSRVESGATRLHEELFDPAKAVSKAVEMLSERARGAGIVLVANAAPDLPCIFADERRLRQVVLNLVSNAIKFTPAGGTVAVRSLVDGESGEFVIEVSDNGVGIEATELPKVFSPFVRGTQAETQVREGTGLGLPLVQRLVALHGGTVAIESEHGAGTTVTVRLPAERMRAEDARRTA